MKATLDQLAHEYRSAIRGYLTGAGESALRQAYELGRTALAQGVGVLEMALMHQQCVADILGPEKLESGGSQVRVRALDFFVESLSAFEMALRGYQEANAQLHRSLNDLLEIQKQLHEQNERLVAANEAVETERRRYRELFEFAPDAYLVSSLDGIIQEANSAATGLLCTPRESLLGRRLLGFIADEEEFRGELERLRNGLLERREDWRLTIRPSGREPILAAITVTPERRANGISPSLRWLLRDVTERKRAEEAQTQVLVTQLEWEAARRFELLAEASSLLASSQDYETTLAGVARLSVPRLADWCFVHVFEPDGSVWQVAGISPDPMGTEWTSEIRRVLRPHRRKNPGLFARIRHSEILDPVSEAWLEQFSDGPEDFSVLQTLGFRSAAIVPFLVRGRILGTLTLLNVQSRGYAAKDLALAEDLAKRCGLALDNVRLYRTAREERDRAEKASRAKDEFLAILGHELRNPLMPVMGWTRILKNHDLITRDPVLLEAVRCLERSSRHIARLVGDCLDLARISRGEIGIDRKTIDVNQVVQASIETVSEAAASKELAFVTELWPQPLWVLGDATRLQQVIMNLLLNAVKYTGNGGRIVVRSSEQEGGAEVVVQDTGVGIEASRLEQIFQPFNPSKNWLRSESGLGLGLAIARRIIEMHAGRIWAASEGPGHGSTFRIFLPLTEAKDHQDSAGDVPPHRVDEARPLRVLVIEDSKDALFLMRVDLETFGHKVFTAADGLSGLDLATKERPDTIISDIKMPGMDGYELIRRMRAVPGLARVPAIAVTGFGMQADVEKALLAGYDASVTKPAEPQELDALIRRLVSSQKTAD